MEKMAHQMDQQRRLTEENRLLRHQLRVLTEEAHKNEAVLKRFHERELSLLTCDSLPLLLKLLTEGMRGSFDLPYITLILLDAAHELRHLLLHSDSHAEDFTDIRFLDAMHDFGNSILHLRKPRLGVYVRQNHGGLFPPDADDIESVALLPMLRNDTLTGCLCLGSRKSERFTRHHASDFLERLATIGAICLENAANREHLLISGMTDALTGLHNRRYLDRRLHEEIARARRYSHPLSCLFVDADHFKRINDTYGHGIGDQVLRELALRVRECLRASDIAIRYGGEEFALILPQTDLQDATGLAERIRSAIANQPVSLRNDQHLPVTVSIGISTFRDDDSPPGISAERLLEQADRAVYQAKHAGRNRCAAWDLC